MRSFPDAQISGWNSPKGDICRDAQPPLDHAKELDGMSKAGCSVALIVVAAIVAGIFYSLANSIIGLDQFFRTCTPGCAYKGSANQFVDLFPVFLFGAVIVGLLLIMRMPERSDAPPAKDDQSPR